MTIARAINLKELLQKKSFFLFGPKATGKSILAKSQLSATAAIVDLLDSRLFLRLSAAPHDEDKAFHDILALHPWTRGPFPDWGKDRGGG